MGRYFEIGKVTLRRVVSRIRLVAGADQATRANTIFRPILGLERIGVNASHRDPIRYGETCGTLSLSLGRQPLLEYCHLDP